MAQGLQILQGDDAFNITKSDTLDIISDANNTKGHKHCLVHNRDAGGEVKVTTINGTDITVYIAQGDVFPLEVKRIWSTGTIPTNLVAIVGKV